MPTTVADQATSSLNRTRVPSVRRIQPNPEGGRPADPLIIGLEVGLEGLIAVRDDREAMVVGMQHLRVAIDVLCGLQAQKSLRRDVRALREKISAVRDNIRRTIEHLSTRAHRLAVDVIPEIQSMVRSLDRELEQRTSLAVFERAQSQ